MTKRSLTALALIITTSALSAAVPASADPRRSADPASLQLPITGTATTGTTFVGTFTLTRFANRGGRVVAVGFLRGTLTSAVGVSLGTGLTGPVELPVTVRGGSAGTPTASSSSAVAFQVQQTCDVLHLDVGSALVDLLGVQLNTMPIGIDLTAVGDGTDVLGRLICTVLETVGNVIGLVNLLNQILGLLGGLGGGLAA